MNSVSTKIIQKIKHPALCFAAGSISVLALPPYGLWFFMLLGLAILYVALARTPDKFHSFCCGYAFGFGYFIFGLSWIANALLVEGNDYAWAWPLAVVGLPLALSFFTGFAALFTKMLAPANAMSHIRGLAAFTVMFSFMEWLRSVSFTGFPWNLYGYGVYDLMALTQIVSVVGIHGLTLFVVFFSASLAFIIINDKPARKKATMAASLFVLSFLLIVFGHIRALQNPTKLDEATMIRLVQPNIAQQDKWKPELALKNLGTLLNLSIADEANANMNTMIIWPETAIRSVFLDNEGIRNSMQDVLKSYKKEARLISGVLRSQTSEGQDDIYFNSLMAFDKNLDTTNIYDKFHLVPFGEYIPFQHFIPLQTVTQFTGFETGSGPQTLKDDFFPSLSPLICYEVIFPANVKDTKNRPDVLINVTNDGWYGDSNGPHQHFIKARFRAIEEGTPLIRAANTGISGVIDPIGRIIYAAPLMTQSGDNVPLPLKLETETIFSHFGNIAFFILISFVGLFWFVPIPKNK
jgi:apolipoprotein N-acyltransferase